MIEQIKELLGLATKIEKTVDQDLAIARKEITDTKAALATATQHLATETATLVQVRADLATATQTIGSLQAQVVAAETAAAAAAAVAETRVPILAASIVAAQGVPALPIKPDTQPATAAGKAPESKLKGRARLVAAIETELA